MKLLSIVVVNYRGFDLTLQMYKSLISSLDRSEFDFVVVDNSQSEDENKNLNSVFEGCSNVFISPVVNKGYFQGLNDGLDLINVDDYKYVVVGNNDIIFAPDFSEKLKCANYADDVYAICPDVRSSEGVHQNPHAVKRFNFLQRLKIDIYFSNYYVASALLIIKNAFSSKVRADKDEEPRIIHMGIGAIYILTASFFKCNRRLEFPFFLYGEEAFLSNQIHNSGGVLFYDPDLMVDHLESATLSKTPSRDRYNWARDGYKVYREYL